MHQPPTLQQPYRASPGEFAAFFFAYLEFLAARREALDQQLHPLSGSVGVPRLPTRGVGEPLLLWVLYQDHVEHVRPAAAAFAGPGVAEAGTACG